MAIDNVVSELRASFESGKTRPIAWRKEQLRGLWNLVIVCGPQLRMLFIGICLSLVFVQDNRDRFAEAIHKDVAKPKVQVEVLEVLCVANEVNSLHHFSTLIGTWN